MLSFLLLASMLSQSGTTETITALKFRAEKGDTKAQVQLGVAYASSNGVMVDDSEAVKWFRKAAGKGDAAGEYSLGEMYLTGRGVSANLSEAAKWMRRAADQGDVRGRFSLAAMYVEGKGVFQKTTPKRLAGCPRFRGVEPGSCL